MTINLVEQYPIDEYSYEKEDGSVVNLVKIDVLYDDTTEMYEYRLNETNIKDHTDELGFRLFTRINSDVNNYIDSDEIQYNYLNHKTKEQYDFNTSAKKTFTINRNEIFKDIDENNINNISEKFEQQFNRIINEEYILTILKNKLKSLFIETEDIVSRDIKEIYKYHSIKSVLSNEEDSEFNVAHIISNDSNISKIKIEDNSQVIKSRYGDKNIQKLDNEIIQVYHKEYGIMNFN
jgi:hypothetical protein